MDFWEKLSKRAEGVNKARVSRAVGLPPNAISSYLAKRSVPRADIALKIARALGVPLDWLLDDSKDWPPPDRDEELVSAAKLLTDSQLMRELVDRRRLARANLADLLTQAKEIDWAAVHRQLADSPREPGLPRNLSTPAMMPILVHGALVRMLHFNPEKWENPNDEPAEQSEKHLREECEELWNSADFQAAAKELSAFPRTPDEEMERGLTRQLAIGPGLSNVRRSPTKKPT
jgi:transcriptional regulator with XRE-family HTH domain